MFSSLDSRKLAGMMYYSSMRFVTSPLIIQIHCWGFIRFSRAIRRQKKRKARTSSKCIWNFIVEVWSKFLCEGRHLALRMCKHVLRLLSRRESFSLLLRSERTSLIRSVLKLVYRLSIICKYVFAKYYFFSELYSQVLRGPSREDSSSCDSHRGGTRYSEDSRRPWYSRGEASTRYVCFLFDMLSILLAVMLISVRANAWGLFLPNTHASGLCADILKRLPEVLPIKRQEVEGTLTSMCFNYFCFFVCFCCIFALLFVAIYKLSGNFLMVRNIYLF